MPRKAKLVWLKGCDVCNVQLIPAIDEELEKGTSLNQASRKFANDAEKKIGTRVWTWNAIKQRYLYIKNKVNRQVVESQPHTTEDSQQEQVSTETESTKDVPDTQEAQVVEDKPEIDTTAQEEQVSEETQAPQLNSQTISELNKADVAASQPQKSELEKAMKNIIKAAELLEDIIEGRIKDNGTSEDKLVTETIIRHLPSFIISAYRLGVDPEQAVNFYNGEKSNGTAIIEGSTRIENDAENNRKQT